MDMRKGLMAGLVLSLSGCATIAPEPCTSEWVEWRTSQITDSFSRQYRSELLDMKRFATRLENPSPLVLLEMTSRLQEFRSMATDFSTSIVPELRSAVDQCGTPTQFATAFSGFLENQGMPDTVLSWIEEIAETMDALSQDT